MAFAHIIEPSSLLLLLLLLALPISYGFRMRRKKRVSSEAELPPGPAQLPIIGNLHLLTGGNVLHRSLWELSKQHGPLMYLKLGRVPTLVVSSGEIAKEVLRTHDVDCFGRPPSIPAFKLSYGNSDVAFNSHGDRWKELRRICTEELLSNRKVASFRFVIEEEISRTMKWIASRTEDAQTADAQVDMSNTACVLIYSIISRTAFSRYHQDIGEKRFHLILKNAQEMLGGFFLGDYLPQLGWVDVLTGMRGRLHRSFHELDSFYEQLIKDHDGLNPGGNMLDSLLHVQRDAKNLTDNEIKALLMNVFAGGTGTSSSIVEWAMSELTRHPEVMRRAQVELRCCVGRKGKVEESDLCQLRYLKAVIKETMRMHPAIPLLIPRESVRGFKLQGYDVAPQTTIIINSFAMGRDPTSWERPNEFLPERFIDQISSNSNSAELSNHHDFKFLPFGEGRRICMGMNLGVLMTELALANLLYCFNWSLPSGMAAEDIDMGEAIGVTMHRRVPLCLVATKFDTING